MDVLNHATIFLNLFFVCLERFISFHTFDKLSLISILLCLINDKYLCNYNKRWYQLHFCVDSGWLNIHYTRCFSAEIRIPLMLLKSNSVRIELVFTQLRLILHGHDYLCIHLALRFIGPLIRCNTQEWVKLTPDSKVHGANGPMNFAIWDK